MPRGSVSNPLAAAGRAVATSRSMSDPAPILDPSRVELALDEGAFPRDAVYGAAYTFIDRCYVRLHRPAEGRIAIVLRATSCDFFGSLQ